MRGVLLTYILRHSTILRHALTLLPTQGNRTISFFVISPQSGIMRGHCAILSNNRYLSYLLQHGLGIKMFCVEFYNMYNIWDLVGLSSSVICPCTQTTLVLTFIVYLVSVIVYMCFRHCHLITSAVTTSAANFRKQQPMLSRFFKLTRLSG